MSWNELWDYVSELLRQRSSHLASALDGDRYVPDPGERAVWDVFELWVNAQGKKGRKLKRPWAGKPPTYKTVAPASGRAERRARLAEMF